MTLEEWNALDPLTQQALAHTSTPPLDIANLAIEKEPVITDSRNTTVTPHHPVNPTVE